MSYNDFVDSFLENLDETRKIQELADQRGELALLMVEVNDDDPRVANSLISKIQDEVSNAKGEVRHLFGALIIATFDRTMPDFAEAQRRSEQTANSLQRSLANQAKVLYGKRRGFYRQVGPENNRRNIIFLIRFDELIAQLSSAEFGTMKEIV